MFHGLLLRVSNKANVNLARLGSFILASEPSGPVFWKYFRSTVKDRKVGVERGWSGARIWGEGGR